MKHYKSLLLFTIAASFCFQGCKKTTVQQPNHYSFSRHVLEYVHLPLGKYLIYKDSASSQQDSVVVTTSKLENKFVPAFGGTSVNLWIDSYSEYFYEVFHLVLTKYNGSQPSNWFVVSDSLNYGSSGGLFGGPLPPATSDTFGVNLFELQGNYLLSAFYCLNSQYSNLSMNIEGKTYNNIIETISVSGNPTDPYYVKTIYYWAKPVGIIKRTIINGSSIKTYTLLRNN